MVSTTAPVDSSLMQVGVKEVTVGSMERCLNHDYCHILTLTSAPTSFQFTTQSFSTDGERTPTPFCTLSSLSAPPLHLPPLTAFCTTTAAGRSGGDGAPRGSPSPASVSSGRKSPHSKLPSEQRERKSLADEKKKVVCHRKSLGATTA